MKRSEKDNGTQTLLLPEAGAQPSSELKSWALVELFGHQRIVGFLSQQTFGTGVLFRVDVPDLLKDGKVQRDCLDDQGVKQEIEAYLKSRGLME